LTNQPSRHFVTSFKRICFPDFSFQKGSKEEDCEIAVENCGKCSTETEHDRWPDNEPYPTRKNCLRLIDV
jgi:hypothetical protein